MRELSRPDCTDCTHIRDTSALKDLLTGRSSSGRVGDLPDARYLQSGEERDWGRTHLRRPVSAVFPALPFPPPCLVWKKVTSSRRPTFPVSPGSILFTTVLRWFLAISPGDSIPQNSSSRSCVLRACKCDHGRRGSLDEASETAVILPIGVAHP